MANYTEVFASKLDWAMPFQRTGKFPLDRTDLFESYADAVKYAAGNTADPDSRGLCGTSYVGQIITVYENSTVTVYKIQEDRTLAPIVDTFSLPIASAETLGGMKVGAGLTVSEDGTVSATGGGTADAVEWTNILHKPTIAYSGVFTHTATTIATLKEQIVAAVTSETLKEYSMYSGSLSGFSTTNFPAATVELTVITTSKSASPVILFWSESSTTDTKNRAWFCYASKTGDAYDNSVYQLTNEITEADLTALNAVIDANYVHTDNNFTSALLTKLNGIASGAQANVIEKVKVNGTEVTPGSDKSVDISVPVISTNIETDSESDTKSASPKAVKEYVTSKISSTYRPAGTIAAGAIPTPSENILGFVYNISESFTTTENFVEGSGKTYPAGTNVVVIQSGENYKLDVLAGFVDLSSYVKDEDLAAVAKSGKWSDIQEKPTIKGIALSSIETSDQSKEITTTGTIIDVRLIDTVTNEVVIADLSRTDATHWTVSFASAPTNPINIMVWTVQDII